MRIGDKITVVQLRFVVRNEHDYVLVRARICSFSFCHGKRRIVYRTCDEIKNVGVLFGKDEDVKFVRGWDMETHQAAALRVALAL